MLDGNVYNKCIKLKILLYKVKDIIIIFSQFQLVSQVVSLTIEIRIQSTL